MAISVPAKYGGTVVVLVPTAVIVDNAVLHSKVFMDLPFFIYQIKTQAVRLAVVMRMATNGNRTANVGRR